MVEVELIAYTQFNPRLKRDSFLLSDPEYICGIAANNTIANRNADELLHLDEEKARRSLKAVMDSGHLSVIEHINFTFLIWDFSRIISQQLTRHRIASFSQRGQRYVKWDNAHFIIPKTACKDEETEKVYVDAVTNANNAYQKLMDMGVSPEDARYVLPNGIETYIVMTMNARELLHFFELRLCARAQWEIRELAEKMLELVIDVAPDIFRYAGPSCITKFYCPEKHRNPKECIEQIKRLDKKFNLAMDYKKVVPFG